MTRENGGLIVSKKPASESALRLASIYHTFLQRIDLSRVCINRVENNPAYSSLRKWARKQARCMFVLVTIQTITRQTCHIFWVGITPDEGQGSRPVTLDDVTGVQGYTGRLRGRCYAHRHEPKERSISPGKGAV